VNAGGPPAPERAMPPIGTLLDRRRARLLWGIALALLATMIAALALLPGNEAPRLGIGDKWQHVLAFAALGFASERAGRGDGRARSSAALGLLAYGGAIELLQTQVPGRSAEWSDLAADALGIACGLLAAAAVDAARRRTRGP